MYRLIRNLFGYGMSFWETTRKLRLNQQNKKTQQQRTSEIEKSQNSPTVSYNMLSVDAGI
jgi:hypothetical protein